MERNQNKQLACRKEVTPTSHAVNWQANTPYLVERYFLVWPQTCGGFVFRPLAIQAIRRLLDGFQVEANGQPKTTSLLVYSSSHDTKESRILALRHRLLLSWPRTRSTGVVYPQHGHVAEPRFTVPSNFGSSVLVLGSSWSTQPSGCFTIIRKSTRLALGRGTSCRATGRLPFLASQSERMSGTSAPQPGPSH